MKRASEVKGLLQIMVPWQTHDAYIRDVVLMTLAYLIHLNPSDKVSILLQLKEYYQLFPFQSVSYFRIHNIQRLHHKLYILNLNQKVGFHRKAYHQYGVILTCWQFTAFSKGNDDNKRNDSLWIISLRAWECNTQCLDCLIKTVRPEMEWKYFLF